VSRSTSKPKREMAQATLDKAKDAVSKYMAESQKLREKADTSVRATYSTANRSRGLLNIVDGLQPIDAVTEQLAAALAALPSPRIRSEVQ
jgi:hypothetical protein